jgi:hypothetical protein
MPNKKRKRDKVNTDNSKDTTVANQKRRIQKEIRVHEEIIKILRKCKDTRKIDLKIIEGAVRGSMHDQHDLAAYYFAGAGITKNYKSAFKWNLNAAEQGLPEAQYNVGILYHHAIGVDKNNKEAFKWFLKAAQQGHVTAQFIIGMVYEKSISTNKKNYEIAIQWYKKAAAQGYKKAQERITELQKSTTKESRIKSELKTISIKQEISTQEQPSSFQLSL